MKHIYTERVFVPHRLNRDEMESGSKMALKSWKILAICLGTIMLSGTVWGRSGSHPCHSIRNVAFMGAQDCECVRIPNNLCRKCRLKPYASNGDFRNCEDIYDVKDAECLEELQKYSKMNPCDTKRKEHLKMMKKSNIYRKAIDYFVYAVCEECCDCIPDGARSSEYNERRDTGMKALTLEERGNCPAHAHYDLCKVWPSVRHVETESAVADCSAADMKKPIICPQIYDWFQSDAALGWVHNNNVEINPDITKFLRNFNRVARCRAPETWKMCTDMEVAQGRI